MGYGNCENLRLRTIYPAILQRHTECGQLTQIHSSSTGTSKLLGRVLPTNPTVTTKSLHLYQGYLTTISLSHISMYEFNTKTNNAGKSTPPRQVLRESNNTVIRLLQQFYIYRVSNWVITLMFKVTVGLPSEQSCYLAALHKHLFMPLIIT